MKKLFALLSLLLSLFVFPAFADAAPSLVDGAHTLTAQEARTVEDRLAEIEKKHEIRIAVVTTNLYNERVGDRADIILDKDYTGGKNGNILLLLDMNGRNWYIATDSKMKEIVTNKNGVPAIASQMVPELSKGNFADAYLAYAKETDKLMDYYNAAGHAYDPNDRFSVIDAAIAAVLAALIALAVRAGLISTMSNVRPGVSAARYLEKGSFKLTAHSDQYLYTNRIVTPLPRKESFSSAGGSFGGGGGKF